METVVFDDFFDTFPEELKRDIHHIVDIVSRAGGVCRIVGGAVRDRVLGRDISDVDLECYGLDVGLFETLMESIGADGVGRAFFVYKYRSVDIALPRRENKTGRGHRGFTVEPVTDGAEACRRRDFTINAMMYDISTSTIFDYYGGLEDIRKKRISIVDEDSFVEDSLRVLRAMQFSARLGFRISEETVRLCRSIELDDLPKERIFSEFRKMFTADYPHYGLYAMSILGIAEKLFGFDIDCGEFISASRDLLRYRRHYLDELRPFYFLAILSRHIDMDIGEFLEILGAPKEYHRRLADIPDIPKNITDSFVASLARKKGVRESPLNYLPEIAERAVGLGVWDSPFDIGVTPTQLMQRGFRGRELGEELERIREAKLKSLDGVSDDREAIESI